MATATQLQVELSIWRRRFRYRDAKLRQYKMAKNTTLTHKWWLLLDQAHSELVALEEQIASIKPNAPMFWIPGAEHRPRVSAGSFVSGYGAKLLWHSTEGKSDATGTLDSNRDHPQLELLPDGAIIQYIPINLSGKSLVHGNGGFPETNRGNVVQVEVVGFTAKPKWSDAQIAGARKIARFVERNNGVPRSAGVPFHPVDGVRMSATHWVKYTGHCAHMHCPNGNDHTDCGTIDTAGTLAKILA